MILTISHDTQLFICVLIDRASAYKDGLQGHMYNDNASSIAQLLKAVEKYCGISVKDLLIEEKTPIEKVETVYDWLEEKGK